MTYFDSKLKLAQAKLHLICLMCGHCYDLLFSSS